LIIHNHLLERIFEAKLSKTFWDQKFFSKNLSSSATTKSKSLFNFQISSQLLLLAKTTKSLLSGPNLGTP